MSFITDLVDWLQNFSIPVSGVKSTVVVSKTLNAALDYTAKDVMTQNSNPLWIFPDMARKLGGGGYITKAIALCSTVTITARLTLYLFNRPPSCTLTDNAANTAITTTDKGSCVGWIDFAAMESLNGMSQVIATPNTPGGLSLEYTCDPNDNRLYGVLVTRDTTTTAAASMTMDIRLTREQY